MSLPHATPGVWVWASAAQTPAGDAAHSLSCIQAGEHQLTRDPNWGWLGRVDAQHEVLSLAAAAADPCWQAASARAGGPKDDPRHWPAIIASSSKGDTGAWLGPARQPMDMVRDGLPGFLSQRLARRWGLRFFRGAPPIGACASGLLAVLAGAQAVANDAAPFAIVGAADHSLQDLLLGGFRSLGVCCGSTLPQAHGSVSTGFAPGEGAGFLALGPHPGAAADPWRLCGGLSLGDASHETRCDDPLALRHLLQQLWALCPEPDIIVCHGTGTRAGDAIELAALNHGPWRNAERLCCKPIIGHALGANAAVELAVALHGPWRRLWKIALGFGGHLAGLALSRNH